MRNNKIQIIFCFILLIFTFTLNHHTQTEVTAVELNNHPTSEDPIHIELGKEYTGQLGNMIEDESGEIGDGLDQYLLNANSITEGYLSLEVSFLEYDYVDELSVNLSYDLEDINQNYGTENYPLYQFNGNNTNAAVPIARSDPVSVKFNIWQPCCNYQMSVIPEHLEKVTYTFRFTFEESVIPSQNDFGSGSDVSDYTYENIPTITFSETYSGEFGHGLLNNDGFLDTGDFYRIETTTSGYLHFDLTLIPHDENAAFWNGDGYATFYHYEMRRFEVHIIEKEGDERVFVEAPDEQFPVYGPGTHLLYFDLNPGYGLSGYFQYTFSVSFLSDPSIAQSIEIDGTYPSDAPDVPLSVFYNPYNQVNETLHGSLGTKLFSPYTDEADLADTYRFSRLTAGEVLLDIQLSETSVDFTSILAEIFIISPEQCYESQDDDQPMKTKVIRTSTVVEFTLPDPSQCINPLLNLNSLTLTNGMFSGFDIAIRLRFGGSVISAAEYLSYQLTLNASTLTNTETINDTVNQNSIDSELNLRLNPLLAMSLITVAAGGVGFYQYKTSPRVQALGIKRHLRKIIASGSLASFIFGTTKEKEINILGDVPNELINEKFILHPIRLAMLKLLAINPGVTPSELKKTLDISWGAYSSNIKALEDRGLCLMKDEVINNSFKQVIKITPQGISKYNYITELLAQYLDINLDMIYPSSDHNEDL
jgi:DNA-binding MarR family transcriptional regulator